ncbi:STAS domain-containing protein [Lentzea sp. CC55]|uniref:STAS domain-containing protein n=1 Tax=Lentzea sp. CC55 TaxID=2884909 RepID=UPI0027E0827A|nr:STAS domain-containing protein [Lentzea sp. CC55]MCG8922971.1 STAS domain-containing protein [Lentzea sp. CC55]
MLRIQVVGTSAAQTEVQLAGALDVAGSEVLLAKLDRLIGAGRHHLVVDVSGVTFCDSSGISALVRGRARAVEMTGSLRLVSPSPAVRHVLEISGLARMFERA